MSDVVRAIWTIVEQAPAGEVYNVGTGKRTTILDLAERLCAAHGGGLVPTVTGSAGGRHPALHRRPVQVEGARLGSPP